jgi:cell division initiation protein
MRCLSLRAQCARSLEASVRLTPLDIRSQRFASRLRGIDAGEVENFLHLVSEDYAALSRERDQLADRVRDLEARVAEMQGGEKLLRDTIVTAQQLAEDLRNTAIRESEVRVSEAEVKAEKVLDAAHRRASKLGEDIRELRAMRSRLAYALRQTVQTHLSLIETIQESADDDAGERAEHTEPRLRL